MQKLFVDLVTMALLVVTFRWHDHPKYAYIESSSNSLAVLVFMSALVFAVPFGGIIHDHDNI